MMSDIILTQQEGDALLQMDKINIGTSEIELPDLGGSIEIKLSANDGHEKFIINFTKYSINLLKRNHQLRCRKVIGLARLDLFGPPHRNPDGEEVGSEHLHLYKEGFDLKWAYEVPANDFTNLQDTHQTLEDFLRYCHVVQPPLLKKGLFS